MHPDSAHALGKGFGILTLATLYPVMFVEILGFVSPRLFIRLVSSVFTLLQEQISMMYSDDYIIKAAVAKESITDSITLIVLHVYFALLLI